MSSVVQWPYILTIKSLNCASVHTNMVQTLQDSVPGRIVDDSPDICMWLTQCSEVRTWQTAINLNPPPLRFLSTDESISNWNLHQPPGDLAPPDVTKQSKADSSSHRPPNPTPHSQDWHVVLRVTPKGRTKVNPQLAAEVKYAKQTF